MQVTRDAKILREMARLSHCQGYLEFVLNCLPFGTWLFETGSGCPLRPDALRVGSAQTTEASDYRSIHFQPKFKFRKIAIDTVSRRK